MKSLNVFAGGPDLTYRSLFANLCNTAVRHPTDFLVRLISVSLPLCQTPLLTTVTAAETMSHKLILVLE